MKWCKAFSVILVSLTLVLFLSTAFGSAALEEVRPLSVGMIFQGNGEFTAVGVLKTEDLGYSTVTLEIVFSQEGQVVRTKTQSFTTVCATVRNIASTDEMTALAQGITYIEGFYLAAFTVANVPTGVYDVEVRFFGEYTVGEESEVISAETLTETVPIFKGECTPVEGAPALAPTCTAAGHTASLVCADCGRTLVASQALLPLGHEFADGVCLRCGKGDESEGLTYTRVGLVYTVSGYKGTDPDVVIPTYYRGLRVTGIASYAFSGNSRIKSVHIPVGVLTIGKDAFSYCPNLENISIPFGTASIGSYAFAGCEKLKTVDLPSTLTVLDRATFEGCTALERVGLHEGLVKIGDYAFNGCEALRLSRLPSTVLSIGDYAFCYCGSLTELTLPEGLISLGQGLFDSCTALERVVLPKTLLSIGAEAFRGCESLSTIDIPKSVKYVGYGAFEYCSSLRRVVIPEGVTVLGESTFEGCSALESVVLPKSLTRISEDAFRDCVAMRSVNIPENVVYIGSGAFDGCSVLQDVFYAGYAEDWADVTFVGSGFGDGVAIHCYEEEENAEE